MYGEEASSTDTAIAATGATAVTSSDGLLTLKIPEGATEFPLEVATSVAEVRDLEVELEPLGPA